MSWLMTTYTEVPYTFASKQVETRVEQSQLLNAWQQVCMIYTLVSLLQ